MAFHPLSALPCLVLSLASAASWAQAAPEPPRLAGLPVPAGYTVVDALQPGAGSPQARAAERDGRSAPLCQATPRPAQASTAAGADGLAAARPSVPAGDAADPASRGTEPQVSCTVLDSESGRIEELRVRGQLQRVRVQPAGGARAYEIQLLDAGRDAAAKSGPGRGGEGQRVWPVLAF